MSTRGVNFLDHWLSDNLDGIIGHDIISVAEAIEQLFADAKAAGISSTEIEEETGSVYETVLHAIVHYEPGVP
jgi:hypothetical protein